MWRLKLLAEVGCVAGVEVEAIVEGVAAAEIVVGAVDATDLTPQAVRKDLQGKTLLREKMAGPRIKNQPNKEEECGVCDKLTLMMLWKKGVF